MPHEEPEEGYHCRSPLLPPLEERPPEVMGREGSEWATSEDVVSAVEERRPPCEENAGKATLVPERSARAIKVASFRAMRAQMLPSEIYRL